LSKNLLLLLRLTINKHSQIKKILAHTTNTVMSGDRRRGGKLPKRDEKKGELVTQNSAKGKSPAAGHERRPKHFGDDVGGTALPIPSKSLNTVSPGTAASNGTASLQPSNAPGVEPLHASHLQGSSMDVADTFCRSQMDPPQIRI